MRILINLKVLILISLTAFFSNDSSAQWITDSTSLRISSNGDSIYTQNKKLDTKYPGMSLYFSGGINFARNKEFSFEAGTTLGNIQYARRGLGVGTYATTAIGYSYSLANSGSHLLKASADFAFVPFIYIGNFKLRGEYLYNLTGNQHYIRPGVGMSFVYFDIVYNYSFLMKGGIETNIFKHGLSFRIKAFPYKKNWNRTRYTYKY